MGADAAGRKESCSWAPRRDLIGIAVGTETPLLVFVFLGSGFGDGDGSMGVAMEADEMRSSRFMASEVGGAVEVEASIDWRNCAMPEGAGVLLNCDFVSCAALSAASLYVVKD